MKKLFIEQLTEDTGKFQDFFQVSQADRKAKKDGQPYYDLKLRDRTGELAAKLWTIPDGLILAAGDVVKIEATCDTYKDALQLKVTKVRVIPREEVILDDYMPASKRDREEMFGRVVNKLCGIQDDALGGVLLNIAAANKTQLLNCPAAMKKHQAYLGGLLEHILNLMGLADYVCTQYPVLDRDIMTAACFLHDIGKLEELVCDTHIAYSREGKLVGHITEGAVLFSKYSGTLDNVTRLHLEHILASHHGRLEWGAARVPMTREATAFHIIDQLDARMGVMDNVLAGPVDAEGFTAYDNALGTAVWNGK